MTAYKLYHGDCLKILPTLEPESVDAIITDPPYGVGYQSGHREDQFEKLENDDRPFIWWLYHAYFALRDGGALLCFTDWKYQDVFKMAIEAAGFRVRSQVIWDRGVHGMGDPTGTFGPRHDVIWFATKGRFQFSGTRPVSVIQSPRVDPTKLRHPTEKPELLMHKLVTAVAAPGATVLDPMCGSGSTGVAALKAGRKFVGIEYTAEYHHIAEARLAQARRDIEQSFLPNALAGFEARALPGMGL